MASSAGSPSKSPTRPRGRPTGRPQTASISRQHGTKVVAEDESDGEDNIERDSATDEDNDEGHESNGVVNPEKEEVLNRVKELEAHFSNKGKRGVRRARNLPKQVEGYGQQDELLNLARRSKIRSVLKQYVHLPVLSTSKC